MSDTLIVLIEEGELRGKKCADHQNGSYYSFYGIPYAKPPLGELRFKSPVPPDKWTGIRDATCEREGCISRHTITFEIVGGEDCLFLNVYTREVPQDQLGVRLKPVMVWIHGGAFSTGSTRTELFGPDFLIVEDVVLVTVSYRLGFLGFLTLEDPVLRVPGNAALRDIIMALKWVQKNIRNFAGDPENVTLFGESSGAVSAHYIMLSPLGKGLFHKAILQSGSALMHWARGRRGGARELAKSLGCNADGEKEILAFLQSAPLDKLFEFREKLKSPILPSVLRYFYPVVERRFQMEAPIIDEEPLSIILKGNYNKVPMIVGYTSEEGIFFEPFLADKKLLVANFEQMVPHTLQLPPGSCVSQLAARKIRDFYFGSSSPTYQNKDRYIRMQSDSFFASRSVATAKHHLKNLGHPIYLYRFSVDASLNIYKKLCKSTCPGASHADDVPYLFKMALSPPLVTGSVEDDTVKRMTKLWTNFARYGDPNPREREDLIDVDWKPVEKGLMHFLDVGEKLTAGVNPDGDRMIFWDEIYNLDPVWAKL